MSRVNFQHAERNKHSERHSSRGGGVSHSGVEGKLKLHELAEAVARLKRDRIKT